MKPPLFWFAPPDRPGLWPRLLAPFAAITAWSTARRVARDPDLRADVPVVCVGNLNLGGTGKTPTVIALVQALAARGVAAHIVSRGYGGRESGPVRVDPKRYTAADVGDEPLLSAAFAPVWIGQDRAAAVRAAQRAGAQAIIMDDGFQNPAVVKDLSILTVDAGIGFGNGRVAPAGPLREPIAAGLARADLVLAIGREADRAALRTRWSQALTAPIAEGELAPLPTGMDWAGARVIAFAGIGRPEKFFATLRALGAKLLATHALEDHQKLPPALLTRLEAEATLAGAQLVTTEKDAVRLPSAFRGKVVTLPVRLELQTPDLLDRALDTLRL